MQPQGPENPHKPALRHKPACEEARGEPSDRREVDENGEPGPYDHQQGQANFHTGYEWDGDKHRVCRNRGHDHLVDDLLVARTDLDIKDINDAVAEGIASPNQQAQHAKLRGNRQPAAQAPGPPRAGPVLPIPDAGQLASVGGLAWFEAALEPEHLGHLPVPAFLDPGESALDFTRRADGTLPNDCRPGQIAKRLGDK